MNKLGRVLFSMCGFAMLSLASIYLARQGTYGWTLFVLLPAIAGALGNWIVRPETVWQACGIGAAIGVAGSSLFLVMGVEGFTCVLMALPIIVPLTMLGSVLTYCGGAYLSAKKPAAMMSLLLPATLFFDTNARPPVYSVSTSMEVNAPPERVWKHVVAFEDITGEPDWMQQAGVASPIRTRIDGTGVGAARRCELSTGAVEERVTVWDEPRVLRFIVTATPPAIRERGLYGPIYPKHLTGYYVSKQGQFVLRALPGGRTLVTGSSWYEHGLWPAEYWRRWSDAVVHHIHRRVLAHIRRLSEENL